MRIKQAVIFLLGSLLCLCVFSAELPVRVTPKHQAIRYVGRFTDDHRFGWTGCMIEVEFTGSAITAELDVVSGDAAGLTVIVDGKPNFLKISKGQKVYPLIDGLKIGETHRIALFKRSEGSLGAVRFGGFQLSDDGVLSLPLSPLRKMLAIGDSITCGYGNEAVTLAEGNTLENENGYMSYAAIAARSLDADLMMVCWSGRGMYRNRFRSHDLEQTIPKIFDQTLPMDRTIKWAHSNYIPDVVVINLGTNDIELHKGDKEPLSKAGFMGAYKQFIERIRAFAPESKIIISIGPMVCELVREWLPELADGFADISVLVHSPFEGPEDEGGHHHPSIEKNQKMARELVEKIKNKTRWSGK